MSQRNVRDLEEVRAADTNECERLSQRLYELATAWETSVVRQQELERQFIDDDLVLETESGRRTSLALDRDGRQERLQELIDLSLRIEELKRALAWIDERRTRLRRRLEGR